MQFSSIDFSRNQGTKTARGDHRNRFNSFDNQLSGTLRAPTLPKNDNRKMSESHNNSVIVQNPKDFNNSILYSSVCEINNNLNFDILPEYQFINVESKENSLSTENSEIEEKYEKLNDYMQNHFFENIKKIPQENKEKCTNLSNKFWKKDLLTTINPLGNIEFTNSPHFEEKLDYEKVKKYNNQLKYLSKAYKITSGIFLAFYKINRNIMGNKYA